MPSFEYFSLYDTLDSRMLFAIKKLSTSIDHGCKYEPPNCKFKAVNLPRSNALQKNSKTALPTTETLLTNMLTIKSWYECTKFVYPSLPEVHKTMLRNFSFADFSSFELSRRKDIFQILKETFYSMLWHAVRCAWCRTRSENLF